jgi:hypothetical protein
MCKYKILLFVVSLKYELPTNHDPKRLEYEKLRIFTEVKSEANYRTTNIR